MPAKRKCRESKANKEQAKSTKRKCRRSVLRCYNISHLHADPVMSSHQLAECQLQLLFSRQNYSNLKHFQLYLGRILIFLKIIFEDRKIFSPSIQIYKNVKNDGIRVFIIWSNLK